MKSDLEILKELEKEIGSSIKVRTSKNESLTMLENDDNVFGDVVKLDKIGPTSRVAITNKSRQVIRLYLNNLHLTELPLAIFKLTGLEIIFFYDNELVLIQKEIENLVNLVGICIARQDHLKEIPKELIYLPNLRLLYVEALSSLVYPPKEIANQGLEAIRNYIDSLEQADEVDYLYESKMVLVGRGFAGKTSLVKKLTIPNYKLEQKIESTEGIAIDSWNLKMPLENSDRFKFNIWDFGGQEKYDATHQFFITERTIYLFVTEARQESNYLDFDYWLNIIQMLGRESPVIIVQNKIDKRERAIATKKFQSQFPNIVGFANVSCVTGQERTIQELRKLIKEAVRKLPQVGDKLPGEWVDVRKELAALNVDHITYSKYCNICKKHGLDKKKADFLSRYFHDLGVIVHHQDDPLLENLVVLNPDWVVDGVYSVLDTKKVERQLGRFSDADLKSIWKNKKYTRKRLELLALMKNYQICFELPEKGNYIAPELLSADPTEYEPIKTSGKLTFIYSYTFLPAGLISRLIVKMHNHLESDNYWRHGLLATFEEARAAILEDDKARQIRIVIEGPDDAKRDLLAIIRKSLQDIYQQFNHKIEYKELVPCICQECCSKLADVDEPHFFDWSTLRRYASKPIEKIRCEVSLDEVNVAQLMGRISNPRSYTSEFVETVSAPPSGEGNSMDNKASQPHVFISYCHDDTKDVERLHSSLTSNGIDVWWDKEIIGGQDWKTEIRKAMKKSTTVLLCLSEKAMERQKSGIYPEAYDAIAAYRQYRPGEIFLIPVRLSKCDIPDIEIDDTRTLDRLQYVDLFPDSKWDENFQKLLKAIQASAGQ
ncbi:MAG: COR domain-containing protein [Calditrichia bacterium]